MQGGSTPRSICVLRRRAAASAAVPTVGDDRRVLGVFHDLEGAGGIGPLVTIATLEVAKVEQRQRVCPRGGQLEGLPVSCAAAAAALLQHKSRHKIAKGRC
jgi:hypothetical protein